MAHQPASLSRNKRGTNYSRSGCLQRKNSHKKCDERKPVCSNCFKRKVECNYFRGLSVISHKYNASFPLQSTNFKDLVWNDNEPLLRRDSATSVSVENITPNNTEVLFKWKEVNNAKNFFPKSCLRMIDLLNFSDSSDTRYLKPKSPSYHEKILKELFINWRNDKMCSAFDVVSKLDPLLQHQEVVDSAKCGFNELEIDDDAKDDFLLTVCQWYIFANHLQFYSLEEALTYANSFQSFVTNYSFLKHAMKFSIASTLKNIYQNENLVLLAGIWSNFVAIPNAKFAFDLIQDMIRDRTPKVFDDHVAVAFCLFLLFLVNSRELYSDWRLHLSIIGSLIIDIQQTFFSREEAEPGTEHARTLYQSLKHWICNIEFHLHINMDNGGISQSIETLNKYLQFAKVNLTGISSNQALSTNFDANPLDIWKHVVANVIEMKNSGLLISGNYMMSLKLNNNDRKQRAELQNIGRLLLKKMKCFQNGNESGNEAKKSGLFESIDLKMEHIKEKVELLMNLSLELYIHFYLIQNDVDPKYFSAKLEEILELYFSLPFFVQSTLVCLSIMYQSASIALLIGNFDLEVQFISILMLARKKGSFIASNLISKIEFLKSALNQKNCSALINLKLDSFG